MSKEFIPYEEALALKELGFDEELCFGFYDDMDGNKAKPHISEGTNNRAILYQQAFRWFREKYSLFMLMQVGQHNGEHQTFYFNIFEYGVNLYTSKFRSKTGIYTYEEAELACLRKLIELINQNKDE
jgi:hypothetical protein